MAATLGFGPSTTDWQNWLQQGGVATMPTPTAQPSPPTLWQPQTPTTKAAPPYDPATASGQSYDPGTGKWKDVAAGGNPDLVYWGPTDTAYYKGQPLTKSQ